MVCMKSSVIEDGAEEVLRGLGIGTLFCRQGAQFELCFRKGSVVQVRQVGVSKLGTRNTQEKDAADLSGVQRQPPLDSAREHCTRGHGGSAGLGLDRWELGARWVEQVWIGKGHNKISLKSYLEVGVKMLPMDIVTKISLQVLNKNSCTE